MLFTPMKIYYCTYSNFHNDPNPTLFVMHSTGDYTEGLNIRYLSGARRAAFFNMIRRLASVGSEQELPEGGKAMVPGTFHYDGQMMYAIIKKYYPDFAYVAYRKYFSRFLTGKIINDTLNSASPLTELYLRTQALMNQATSNFLEMHAKNDESVKEINRALYGSRVEDMRNYENLQYTVQKAPGPSVTSIPGQQSPEDEEGFGEDVTP